MTVTIYNPESNISNINGFTIVVDVFRAFSVSYYISANNPEKYIAINDVDSAFKLSSTISNSILIGEREGIKIKGFDFGNSPTEIINKDFSKNVIIHTTTAGTKGLLRQPKNNVVVVGSFVNASILEKYITQTKIDIVNIYCTAKQNELFGEEDYYFANYLKNKLLGINENFNTIKEKLKMGSGKGFCDNGFAPYSDFEYCMDLNRFNTILKRKVSDENEAYVILEKLV